MTHMFDYTVPDHVPQELIFPLDGESHPELKKNPFKVFANLHKETPPIFYNPAAFQGAGGWSISDGAIIKEVLQSPELFSSKCCALYSRVAVGEVSISRPMRVC
jgi:hypothetical protein